MIIVADTTPVNYLVLIEADDLLPRLFGHVVIPPAVFLELKDAETPSAVRSWLANAPSWLRVQPLRFGPDSGLDFLDAIPHSAPSLAKSSEI